MYMKIWSISNFVIFCLICCFEMALNLMSGLHCNKCDLRVKLVLFCQGFKSFSSNKNIQMNTKLNKVWPLAINFAWTTMLWSITVTVVEKSVVWQTQFYVGVPFFWRLLLILTVILFAEFCFYWFLISLFVPDRNDLTQ